ncbi:MAG: hypothetical protein H5U40_16230 [Polyangiaceae bacterium]|nr:hypothetical protein [Polyangiaceae bacterium]
MAKGSQRWLELVQHASPERCIEALRAEGRTVFVAAMDGEHRPEDLAGRPRVAVVFGNERHGASAAMREAADGAFAIPMQGFVESLNVSVAAAITLYTLGRDAPSRATADEQLAIVARLLLNTVNDATKIVSEPEAM